MISRPFVAAERVLSRSQLRVSSRGFSCISRLHDDKKLRDSHGKPFYRAADGSMTCNHNLAKRGIILEISPRFEAKTEGEACGGEDVHLESLTLHFGTGKSRVPEGNILIQDGKATVVLPEGDGTFKATDAAAEATDTAGTGGKATTVKVMAHDGNEPFHKFSRREEDAFRANIKPMWWL
jgi:hypothetical protein